jgi:hypothetical protein
MRRRLRFIDLLNLNVVQNRTTLRNWQMHRGFPLGKLTANTRTWDEGEIEAWLDAQPSEPKPVPNRGPGRPRKLARAIDVASA